LDAITILRGELKQGHDILEQAVAGLPADQLHHQGDGSTIQSIATIYAHTVLAEDWFMNTKILDRPSLFERDGWEEKVGIGMIPIGTDPEPWLESISSVDFGKLREYAEQVYAESDACLSDLTESDLDRTVKFVDEMPLGSFVAMVIAWHAVHHGGEICALKGVQGGKGLPF
jgi:uncharacterized damage-inducible protein DinB